jgi:uncharacterized membrane protein YccC
MRLVKSSEDGQARLWGLVASLYGDPAIRHGIKLALAGTLAFFVSLLIRLETPIWSLLTVMVIMIAQYVGAIAEKSFYRILGTVIGAVIGFLLTGALEQSPVIYLLAVGAVVAVSVTMFGQSRAPYAFFLCGLTVTVIASNGMANPGESWKFALARTEEVFIGVMASMLVSSLVWPRYAREDFKKQIHSELTMMGREFEELASVYVKGGDGEAPMPGARLRVAALSTLLQFGSRESVFFRRRLPTYSEITSVLARMAATLEMFQDAGKPDPAYRETMGKDFEALVVAIADTFKALSADKDAAATEALTRFAAARTAIDQTIEDLRKSRDLAKSVPAGRALEFGNWMLATGEMGEFLMRLQELIRSIPEVTEITKEPLPVDPPPLDPFWIRNGIRAGIAVAAGLFVQNWLHPPGGSMVTLATFVFSALTRLYPGGEGDRRAFHYVAITAVLGIFYVLFLVVITPVMSDYLAFNTLLFCALFLFGYHTYGVQGMGFGTQIIMLTIVCTVGLNAQEPVTFQQITGVYFGLTIGVLISALVQRLVWPVLPQWQLRDRLIEWTGHCRRLLADSPPEPWRYLRMALLPGEVRSWISVMNKPDCSPEDQERLRVAGHALARLSSYLRGWHQKPDMFLPKATREAEEKSHLEVRMALVDALHVPLDVLAGRPVPDSTRKRLTRALNAWLETSSMVRVQLLKTDTPNEQSIRVLGHLGRTAKAAEEGLATIDAFSKLSPKKYLGDYIL